VLRGVRPSSARGDEFDLLAPAAGVVQERGLAVGAEVRADAVGFVIITSTERWIEAQAPENLLVSLGVGDHVELTDARGDAQSGRVVAIGNQIDPSTRNAMLRAAFPDGVRMLAGAVAELKVFHETTVPTFEIPSVAVVRHEGGDVVFVRTSGGFRAVSVKCGVRLGGRVAVQGKLSASDEVAVSGVSALKALAQQS
jgi:multidrug efflux pump subunit AcrA (membrane-fusion protein)